MDADLLWTVQFAAAKAVGMGLEMPLAAADWTDGFDLLLVAGTKGSFSVAEAGQQIQALLDNHHYTRGLAFIPPGTPTSNQPGAPSAYPPPDPGGADSFAVERGVPTSGDGLTILDARRGCNAAAIPWFSAAKCDDGPCVCGRGERSGYRGGAFFAAASRAV